MRFSGFELPIQFYIEDSGGLTVFEDYTGHHFHSQYIDIVFWHGLIGLVLVMSPILVFIIRLVHAKKLEDETVIIGSFIVSGLFFGVSYPLPWFFYGFLGMGFAYLDFDKDFNRINS
jgi:hypothetical protein